MGEVPDPSGAMARGPQRGQGQGTFLLDGDMTKGRSCPSSRMQSPQVPVMVRGRGGSTCRPNIRAIQSSRLETRGGSRDRPVRTGAKWSRGVSNSEQVHRRVRLSGMSCLRYAGFDSAVCTKPGTLSNGAAINCWRTKNKCTGERPKAAVTFRSDSASQILSEGH